MSRRAVVVAMLVLFAANIAYRWADRRRATKPLYVSEDWLRKVTSTLGYGDVA